MSVNDQGDVIWMGSPLEFDFLMSDAEIHAGIAQVLATVQRLNLPKYGEGRKQAARDIRHARYAMRKRRQLCEEQGLDPTQVFRGLFKRDKP